MPIDMTNTASIDAFGAAVQEAPSCNGWLFWHVERRDGTLRLLDELRAELVASQGG